MNSPRSITFLITSLNGGGAEKQLQHLACGLKNRGWIVSVIAMIYPDNTAIAINLAKAEIPIHYLGMKRGKSQISAIFKLTSLIRQINPDIVHSHMVHANILARITRLFCKMKRLICTAHSINECHGKRALKFLYRITDSLADLTTHVSSQAADKYVLEKIVTKKRMRYIPNGIPIKDYSFSQMARNKLRLDLGIENKFVWITVARMEPPKDFFTLLAAFRNHCAYDSILLLVGDGVQRPQIEEYVREFELQERVKLLGFRTDVPELLSASDAFALSSEWEGLPLVVGEAMSIGLPVVSTNNGGQIEFVLDKETGFLVPVGDIVAFGQKMSEIERMSSHQREQYSKNAQEHVKNYDIERIIDLWEKVYAKDL
jgi:glycosyltransferase involved in cell wall biosynthesis